MSPAKKKKLTPDELVAAVRTTAAYVKTLHEPAFAKALAEATPGSLSSLLEALADVEEESRC